MTMYVDFWYSLPYNGWRVGGIIMAGHQDPNYVTENPFEGRGRAMQDNDFGCTGAGFTASIAFFGVVFIIAIILEVATR